MPGALLLILTSSSLQFRRTGSCLLFILTSSFSYLRRMSSYYSHLRALPSTQMNELLPIIHIDELFPQHRWRSSCLLFVLASSSLNLDGRAPTINSDESFTTTQMDGLLPIIHIDELFPSTQKDDLLLFTLTSSSLNSDGRALAYNSY